MTKPVTTAEGAQEAATAAFALYKRIMDDRRLYAWSVLASTTAVNLQALAVFYTQHPEMEVH